jgi:uncharacterized protein YrrD
MQRNVNSLIGYSLQATDGEIGKLVEFYFDDETWTIRYLIVKTGNWLSGRKVLISPGALIKTETRSDSFPVALTKEQIRNSPNIETDKPVSRQHEIELYGYYPWQSYWGSGTYGGGGIWGTTSAYPVIEEKVINEPDQDGKRADEDIHLRSTLEVSNYHIHANDGEIGHVKDFIMDDQTWQLAYLVVDTHNWIAGKKVLIAVGRIKKLEWENAKIYVDVSVESVKRSTVYNESAFTVSEPDDQGDHTHSFHLK